MSDAPEFSRARKLTGERVDNAVYVARNDRGAEVRIGDAETPGVFSPGELLQIAAVACASSSADFVLRSRLGRDIRRVVQRRRRGVTDENRYSHIDTEVVVDMSELPADKQEALMARAAKAIERLRGFEPLTFSLRTRRATNCAIAPGSGPTARPSWWAS